MFRHDEFTQKPVLDSSGSMALRDEFYLEGINCDPFTFDAECGELNDRWKKNRDYSEIKSHHYIISFDPKDNENPGLTGEWAQRLGLQYARKNFPGHQALVCTHTDGSGGSGNIHVHIVINSLRKFDVERQDFMERPCDSRAGNKHHLTKKYLAYLKQEVMDMCRRENLHQVDLLTPAEKKITEKEYWAQRRGQKNLEKHNRQTAADGAAPRTTKYQTQKQFLRNSIADAAHDAKSLEEFLNILSEKYGITVKESRGRFSYLHPKRNKPITGKQLGAAYEKEAVLQLIRENISRPSENSAEAVLFIKSDLRLVRDLQSCVKAQQSRAYAQKAKLSNLKEMAKTVAYIQKHGYDTRERLEESLSSAKAQTSASRKALKSVEEELKNINEQIHYTGQYFAKKAVYAEFCRSKDKGIFRKEHSAEIALYEAARKFLKEKSGGGKLPSMKVLKAKKEELLERKKSLQEKYHYCRDRQKELDTVRSNVEMILGRDSPPDTKKKEQSIT